jgi:hypothetical protein
MLLFSAHVRRGVAMSSTSRFEIFQKLPDKQATYVEAGNNLEEAKKRLSELAVMFPADYFIFDRENACLIIPCDSSKLETADKAI